jgi:beta-galactosidase
MIDRVIPFGGRKFLPFASLMSLMSLIFLLNVSSALSDPGRFEKELSGEKWRLWLDKKAHWIDDDIYMPPVTVSSLPVNPPTCGWDKLESFADKIISVPATVEEHFWSRNGNPWGEAGDYRGVSWFSTSFSVDSRLKGKRITLAFDSVVLRAEVFVNRKLVGYDIIGNTPFEVDITGAVIPGGQNTLDVRVTDPAGNFDWSNNDMYRWGKNWVPAYHGFGGITGKVYLRATDGVRVDDIYVQNKPKITEAGLFITLKNFTGKSQKGELSVVIHEWKNPSAILWKKMLPVTIPTDSKEVSLSVIAPKAKT